jgi:hypothetical protein
VANNEDKNSYYAGNQSPEREGFGDDMGTRVGRPDQARRAPLGDTEEHAGPSTNTSANDLEGSILEGSDSRHDTGAGHHGQSTGAGAEGAQGIHDVKAQRGTLDHEQREQAGMEGSEPLEGRGSEHKPSYGGEGGAPRTSSDQRENRDYDGSGEGKAK